MEWNNNKIFKHHKWGNMSVRHEVSHENVEENEQMKNWIILYRVSTVNLFSNPNIVQNIKKVDE